ncbi:hypothetical protein [Collinsella intestinalis]|nr:hypothetical protein [Collinsella intestinalis]
MDLPDAWCSAEQLIGNYGDVRQCGGTLALRPFEAQVLWTR